MRLKSSFKLYKHSGDGLFHVVHPAQSHALCGVYTFGCEVGHPNDATPGQICQTCVDRHENKPGAWAYERNAGFVAGKLQRIGASIYSDYQNGLLTWEVANASLESLNVSEDLWLGMPEIPEVL